MKYSSIFSEIINCQNSDEVFTYLKQLAEARGMSVNKLIEELSTIALAEFDAESRFRAMAAKGNTEDGLKILEKLDALTK